MDITRKMLQNKEWQKKQRKMKFRSKDFRGIHLNLPSSKLYFDVHPRIAFILEEIMKEKGFLKYKDAIIFCIIQQYDLMEKVKAEKAKHDTKRSTNG